MAMTQESIHWRYLRVPYTRPIGYFSGLNFKGYTPPKYGQTRGTVKYQAIYWILEIPGRSPSQSLAAIFQVKGPLTMAPPDGLRNFSCHYRRWPAPRWARRPGSRERTRPGPTKGTGAPRRCHLRQAPGWNVNIWGIHPV